jgi:hypothetical protein
MRTTVSVKRMFSCCERKLLVKIDHVCVKKFEIYVKNKPCVFCDDALKAVGKNAYNLVFYIKKQNGKMERKVIDYLIMLGRKIANDDNPIYEEIYDRSF